MQNQLLRGRQSLLLVGAVAALVGCGTRGANDRTGDSAMQAAADSSTAMRHDTAMGSMGASSTASTGGAAGLTDANIVAILDAANKADSAAGAIAVKKGTNADVRDFGKQMMRDHHALRAQGQALARKLNVTPAMPAGDMSQAQADSNVRRLTTMAKGAAWDSAYINHEVAYHQQVLQTATQALSAAQNAELKDLIQKAAPNIQAHLTRAQSIQTKLGGGTT